MALIDYKISKMTQDNHHIKVVISVYRGVFKDVVEPTRLNGTQTVNRYVRQAKVRERTFEYDIPRDMTIQESLRKARALLNKRIIDWATANGHIVITEQQDISEYEAVSNETEK